jgi:hypothetical protein
LQCGAQVRRGARQIQCAHVVSRFFGALRGAAQPAQGIQLLTGPEQSAGSLDRHRYRLGVERFDLGEIGKIRKIRRGNGHGRAVCLRLLQSKSGFMLVCDSAKLAAPQGAQKSAATRRLPPAELGD